MRWSWRIGSLAGIDIRVHATFLLLIAWVAWVYYREEPTLAAVASGVLFVLILFGIVVLHELSHSLTARRFGIETSEIVLLPIGGISRLERMPEDPRQELLVAIAGPALNIALAVALFGVLAVWRGPGALFDAGVVDGSLLATLVWVNVALAAFNLLPAFPMDGGRVLRAFLALWMERPRATQIAAYLGQAMAFLFVLAGFYGNPILVLIGVFVWLGAGTEAAMTQMEAAMKGYPVRLAMVGDPRSVSPGDSLRRPADLLLSGYQQEFPVEEDGQVVGWLTRKDLFSTLARLGPTARVADAMDHDFPAARPDDALFEAFRLLRERGRWGLPVVNGGGRLIGIVTADHVESFLKLEAALGQGEEPDRGDELGWAAARG